MLLRLCVLLLSVLALLGGYVYLEYQKFIQAPIGADDTPVSIVVARGDGVGRVVQKLQAAGFEIQPELFKLHARLTERSTAIRVGEYRIHGQMSAEQVLAHLTSDDVVQYRFTLIEGWSLKQLLQELKKHTDLEQDLEALDAEALAVRLALAEPHAEGQFLPETYHFVRGTKASGLLLRAHKDLQAALAELWPKRAKDLPLANPYEALILASIIEKESAVAEERPEIAGVFVNRLRKDMKLQTDPTVIYGMGDQYQGNIRRKDLRTDTPYNTYTRKGLPPTPIAMPSRAAIEAALQPASTEAIFFVAMGDGTGRHKFSKTLAEHEAAVRKYILKK